MTDYGHDLVFGALLESPADATVHSVVDRATVMEEAGLDLVTLADHPYWPERHDTLTLLGAIAARTSRIRLATNCANLPLRPPTMLARQAATLDRLSDGRFELGLATGAQQMWDAIVAEGGPARTAGQSIEALAEATPIIRQLWVPDQEVRFDGRHYRVDGARSGRGADHPIDIWFGAYQPRLLKLTGRLADAWIPSSPFLGPAQLAAANAIIDEAAEAAGRAPAAVRRVYNIAPGDGFLEGPSSVWVEQLSALALTEGISAFLLYRVWENEELERFAAEVAPGVREAVAKARAQEVAFDPSGLTATA